MGNYAIVNLDYCHPREDGYQNLQMHSMAIQSQHTKLYLISIYSIMFLKFVVDVEQKYTTPSNSYAE
jgi:hypothetical protein